MNYLSEYKAELFDYLASRIQEMKLQLSNGGHEWLYHEGDSQDFIRLIESVMIDEEQA